MPIAEESKFYVGQKVIATFYDGQKVKRTITGIRDDGQYRTKHGGWPEKNLECDHQFFGDPRKGGRCKQCGYGDCIPVKVTAKDQKNQKLADELEGLVNKELEGCFGLDYWIRPDKRVYSKLRGMGATATSHKLTNNFMKQFLTEDKMEDLRKPKTAIEKAALKDAEECAIANAVAKEREKYDLALETYISRKAKARECAAQAKMHHAAANDIAKALGLTKATTDQLL